MPADKDMTTASVFLRHVRVNAAANYYNIVPLRRFANEKVREWLAKTLSTHGLCKVIEEAFSLTTDEDLRNMITATVVERLDELLELKEFKALEVVNPFTLKTLKQMQKVAKAKHDTPTVEIQPGSAKGPSFHKQVTLLQEKLARMKDAAANKVATWTTKYESVHNALQKTEARVVTETRRRIAETARADRLISQVDAAMNTLTMTDECRHCGAAFSCLFDRGGQADHPVYTLRCGACSTKHRSRGS